MSNGSHFASKSFSILPLFPRLACLLITLLICLPIPAQQKPMATSQSTNSSEQIPEIATDDQQAPGEVVIEGRHVLKVYQQIGNYTPSKRAALISQRILEAARDVNVSSDSVMLTPRDAW